jgi:excisionase family DNA binding protein
MTAQLSEMLAPSQVARRVGVSDQLVRVWIRTGRLPSVRTALGHLVRPEDADRLAAERERRRVQREHGRKRGGP